jgi:hypothetical protein
MYAKLKGRVDEKANKTDMLRDLSLRTNNAEFLKAINKLEDKIIDITFDVTTKNEQICRNLSEKIDRLCDQMTIAEN